MLKVSTNAILRLMVWAGLIAAAHRLFTAAEAEEPATAEHVLLAVVVIVLVLDIFLNRTPREKETET